MNDVVPQFPWSEGDHLFASALNAAIANGPYMPSSIANVVYFGADRTGAADSTSAFLAAVATGSDVYAPAGNYRIRNQITLGNGQEMFGDGRGQTVIMVDQTFNSTALAVIALTGGEQLAPTVRDLRISFAQPSDQASRANFRTLAAGGTSVLGGTGVMYPPAIGIRGANRFRLRNLRIDGAWDGIINATGTGNIGGFVIDNIEMGALNCGLSIDNVLDFGHIKTYHFWPFGLNIGAINTGVWTDGNTFGAKFGANGQVNGLTLTDFCVFQGRVSVNTVGTWIHAANVMMDGNNATMEVTNCQWLMLSNIYFSGTSSGANTNSQLTINNGYVFVNNMFASTTLKPIINQPGGRLLLSNSVISQGTNSVSAITTRGIFEATGNSFGAQLGAWTVPYIAATAGSVSFHGNRMANVSPGDVGALVITADSVSHNVSDNFWNGWAWNPPGRNGSYGFDSDGVIGSNTCTQSLSVTANGAAGTYRGLAMETAGSPRWSLSADNATESGSNAGSNLIINNFSDTGVALGPIFRIARATGAVSLLALPATTSYANDAAAAAAGVVVGQLYRNGSAVMVRVV